MKILLSSLAIYIMASLPFAYVIARIIYFGSRDDE